MARAYLGLGANLGDREENLREALRRIAARCEIAGVSRLHESAAVVPPGQPPGPDFLNAACAVETTLSPADLLAFVKSLERALGRNPAAPRWSARPLDVDILLYGELVLETPGLIIPHPRMHERAFVLVPLAEIAGDAKHPWLGRTVAELAAAVDVESVHHVASRDWPPRPR
jgi:2-amino-4-hydroxy-6-hydroxymethyldihydropteridine diphosphokinase